MGVALQAEAAKAFPAVLVGQVEVSHQVLCGRLLHVELVSILLVEEAHFLKESQIEEMRRMRRQDEEEAQKCSFYETDTLFMFSW